MGLDRRGMTLIEVLAVLVMVALLSAALFAFVIGASRGAAQSRRVAYAGQNVERAMTLLRQELAGATELSRDSDPDKLVYRRVRDGQKWVLELEGDRLQRCRLNEEGERTGDIVVLVEGIHYFEFTLPGEVDGQGSEVHSYLIVVTVRSEPVELKENIFLRNYY